MPGKVKVKIVSGRNLPIMDRSNLTTDAYVEVKLGSTIYKTDVYRKSLNPIWNSEWFRFEMDDLELQDEPLQLRLMDHDTYSSNDAIGKVYLDLNPLLCNSSRGKDTSGKMISGWIPVYDTMHGIRGEVNLIVKVELFSDLNKFRQSSCGVRFFFTQSVPEGYIAHIMQGFVEELVVNDDPEYQWIDKIRTPRASNEARQTLFSKLSGELQRKVGLKALELGGNAVIGYKQCFDLEGESGIVVRGIGTAAYLTKQYESQLSPTCGETLGLSREFTDGYRSSLTKSYSRSLRRRGCPSRAPRLQRRSFRVTSSSDSMSLLHSHQSQVKDDVDWPKRKCHHDNTCCVLGRRSTFEGEGTAGLDCSGVNSSPAKFPSSSVEVFKERRSASFREDSLMRLVKFHLKKSLLTASTQSIPPSTSSSTSATTQYNQGILLRQSSQCNESSHKPSQKSELTVATSEPCIPISSAHEGFCPSTTVPASPLPQHCSLTTPSRSTSCRSRSTSRSPRSTKSRHSIHTHNNLFETSSAIIEDEAQVLITPCTNDDPKIFSSLEKPRSQSALASCMLVHHRTQSDTLAITCLNDQASGLSKSATNLTAQETMHGFAHSRPFESAASNLDSNIEEDSTSDTSIRNAYRRPPAKPPAQSIRGRIENHEIESDTSKDFTKATSSGNEGCSVDNDELSPVSEREGFLMLRKKRGSRRKDRYSKSSLMKRASANFYEKGYLLGGTEKIKEEFVKLFKRKKSSDDNESVSSSTTKNTMHLSSNKKSGKAKSSPYREAKFFFRRRRTTSSTKHSETNTLSSKSKSFGQLFRSNSDSHSVGQTSLDSMPSVGSEPLFDSEDEDSSRHDYVTSTAQEAIYLNEKLSSGPNNPTVPAFEIPEEEESETQSVINTDCRPSHLLEETESPLNDPAKHKVLQLSKSRVVEIITELGYSTESPLKLYISSMDALLVYDPAADSSPAIGAFASATEGAFSNASAFCTSRCSCKCGVGQVTPATRSPYELYRHDTIKVRPLRKAGSTNASFSTVSMTTDSLSTSASESARNSCSIFEDQLLGEDRVLGTVGSDVMASTVSGSARVSCCPQEYGCSRKGDYYHPIREVESSRDSVLLYTARGSSCFGEHCEDILEVVRRDEDRLRETTEAELNENVNNIIGVYSDGEIGVAGCTRSPIPEELLFDRVTPTQQPVGQHSGGNNTLGGSHVSATTASATSTTTPAATNNNSTVSAVSVIPYTTNVSITSNPSNSSHPSNTDTLVPQRAGCQVARHVGDHPNSESTSKTATTTTNSNAMTGGDASKRVVGTNPSPEEKTINGARNDVIVDGKTSLASPSPCPYHPQCELHNNRHHQNGQPDPHPHRHPLHHQSACKEREVKLSWSQENSMETNDATAESLGQDKNGEPSAPGSKQSSSRVPHHHHQAHRFNSTGSCLHSNLTSTTVTPATGTAPIAVGANSGGMHRRSSESDLSTPPKANTITNSIHMRGFASTGLKPGITTTIDQYGLMEYPFITISQFPPGFLTHIGGTVTARSVKLLERISNLEEPESRDAWWNEIRMEIRAHCRAFGCTVVIGYEEHTTMCDDVCILSASGTAAIAATTIGLKNVELLTVSTKQGTSNPPVVTDIPCPGRGIEKDRSVLSKMENILSSAATNGTLKHLLVTPSKFRHSSDNDPNCSILHIPSNPAGLPFPVKLSKCHICRKGRVPDVLLLTVDVPPGLHITGKGTLIQAQVFRPKKDCKGEISAKEVSDSLPFLEYELHRRLINKLKVKGMNAIFGLKVQICLGDKLMVAVATGTAMFLSALPPPGVPIITAGNLKTDSQKVLQYQKVVQDAYDRNRQHYDLKSVPLSSNGRQSGSSGEDSDEEESTEVHSSNKDTYILEVDDAEDIDIISMLIDPHPTSNFVMNNIDYLHGYEEHNVSSQQMFTQVWRCRIPTLSLRQFTAYFERLIRAVCFKLRKMMPCVLSKLSFRVELPEPDEMQISIIGLALGMVEHPKLLPVEKVVQIKSASAFSVSKEETELIFPLEEDTSVTGSSTSGGTTSGTRPSDSDAAKEHRGTPPPPGIVVPVVGPMNNSGLALIPRIFPHQSCTMSSSPHTHCSSHLSGNGCGHVSQTINPKPKFTVEITPLAYIPGARIEKYLGNLNFFFIRETTSIRETGGLSGFVHNFIAEILAIVRAHVAALGGNAMVSYFMTELALLHNPHKNQGQCLINVGGDVVLIVHPSSFSDDAQLGS